MEYEYDMSYEDYKKNQGSAAGQHLISRLAPEIRKIYEDTDKKLQAIAEKRTAREKREAAKKEAAKNIPIEDVYSISNFEMFKKVLANSGEDKPKEVRDHALAVLGRLSVQDHDRYTDYYQRLRRDYAKQRGLKTRH